MRHERWISTSLRLAKKSTFWPYKMACIVVRGGKIIASGTNKQVIAESKDKRYDQGRSIHAELAAVLTGKNLKDATAYIAGWTKGDKLVCSKPCSLCQQILEEAGIKAAYYHDQNGLVHEC